MSFKVTDSGVTVSKGRGKNAVALDVSFQEIEKWARKNALDTPKLMRRSFGRACSGLKKQFVQVMAHGGGLNGVPKFRDFEAFTQEVRKVRGIDGRPMGGVLADNARIVAFKRNGYQVIGWPDDLAKWAVNFQDGVGNYMLGDATFRRYYHERGIKYIPMAYVHNPRPVMTPFADHVRAHLDDWATKIYFKDLAKQMQKTGAISL